MTQTWNVREARSRRKPPMTQVQLADKVGVDQTYISLIEAGKRCPSEDIKRRLAKALRIAPSMLRFTDPDIAEITPASDTGGHYTTQEIRSEQ